MIKHWYRNQYISFIRKKIIRYLWVNAANMDIKEILTSGTPGIFNHKIFYHFICDSYLENRIELSNKLLVLCIECVFLCIGTAIETIYNKLSFFKQMTNKLTNNSRNFFGICDNTTMCRSKLSLEFHLTGGKLSEGWSDFAQNPCGDKIIYTKTSGTNTTDTASQLDIKYNKIKKRFRHIGIQPSKGFAKAIDIGSDESDGNALVVHLFKLQC